MAESGINFRKSSYSLNNGNCVETASDNGAVMVRDTTNRDGVALVIDRAAWSKFTNSIK
jgi:hypothetical protein